MDGNKRKVNGAKTETETGQAEKQTRTDTKETGTIKETDMDRQTDIKETDTYRHGQRAKQTGKHRCGRGGKQRIRFSQGAEPVSRQANWIKRHTNIHTHILTYRDTERQTVRVGGR